MSEPNPYRAPAERSEPVEMLDARRQDRVAIVFVVVCAALGLTTGIVSRYVRPMIPGGIHYEALAAVAVLISSELTALVLVRRQSLRYAWLNFNLASFALWHPFAIGWSIVEGGLWDDMIVFSFSSWLVCAFVGSGLLYGFKKLIGHTP